MATKSVSSVAEPSPSANARRLRAATREPARRFRSPPRSSRNSRPARASRTQSTRYPLDGKGRPLLGAGGRFLFAETCLFCNRQQLAGRAISSAVERLVYTENVGGWVPPSPPQQSPAHPAAVRAPWAESSGATSLSSWNRREGLFGTSAH